MRARYISVACLPVLLLGACSSPGVEDLLEAPGMTSCLEAAGVDIDPEDREDRADWTDRQRAGFLTDSRVMGCLADRLMLNPGDNNVSALLQDVGADTLEEGLADFVSSETRLGLGTLMDGPMALVLGDVDRVVLERGLEASDVEAGNDLAMLIIAHRTGALAGAGNLSAATSLAWPNRTARNILVMINGVPNGFFGWAEDHGIEVRESDLRPVDFHDLESDAPLVRYLNELGDTEEDTEEFELFRRLHELDDQVKRAFELNRDEG